MADSLRKMRMASVLCNRTFIQPYICILVLMQVILPACCVGGSSNMPYLEKVHPALDYQQRGSMRLASKLYWQSLAGTGDRCRLVFARVVRLPELRCRINFSRVSNMSMQWYE